MKHRLYNPQAAAGGQDAAKDLTIIMQGRLSKRGLDHLAGYQQFGRVIISCWETCDRTLLADVDLASIPVVMTEPPEEGRFFNYGNVFLQTLTTLHGAMHAATPWALKVRCDEFYTDLSAFIARMQAHPQKLITNNIFFRKDAMYKFHLSDHVIGGRTENLRETFRILRDRCTAPPPSPQRPADLRTPGWMPTEALIATSYLRHRGIAPEPARSKQLMREWFDLVRVSQMGAFYCACNNAHTGYTREEDITDSIASMEEL